MEYQLKVSKMREKLRKEVSKFLPAYSKPYLKKVWFGFWTCWDRILLNLSSVLDSVKLIGPDQIYEDKYFAKRHEEEWKKDAKKVSDLLNENFQPDSVIDFGCGIGLKLHFLKQEYDVEVKGIDGSQGAIDNTILELEEIEKYDLRNYYNTNKSYDLVMCFEVLEHIPEKFSDNLVQTISEAGNTAVITAAPPGQGGKHHVNEKPRDYWLEKFSKQGMDYDSHTTQMLKDDIDMDKMDWIEDNLFVFRQR
jgi:cyclopropane fatty-acyl-phospholipid synthase-like methyltransferase